MSKSGSSALGQPDMALPPRTLYVGNLPFGTAEADLRALFGAEGEVAAVRLILDHRTGRFRGFGFVTFVHSAVAVKAARVFDGFPLEGRPLRVSLAQPLRSEGAEPATGDNPAVAEHACFDKADLKRPLGPREDPDAEERRRRRARFDQHLQRSLRPPRR